jgi:membrane-bound lytic murein transglycosylase C
MVRNFEAKGAERYRPSVSKYSSQYQVSPSLIFAIIRTESNFNPFAISGAPAYGLMQLVPTSGGRAAFRRVKGVDQTPTPEYLFDPDHNIEFGTAYLSVLANNEFPVVSNHNSRDYCVIAAYNTGPRNVARSFANDKNEALRAMNGLPPAALYDRLRTSLPYEETRQYLVKVTNSRRQFIDAAATPAATNP